MKISRIKINSILGIDSLEFDAGKFNAITGANGTGKTSVLEAIKGALKGGHDATLLRQGSESGEVVLVLDDGTTISKRVGLDGSKQSVTTADGRKVSSPAAALQVLTDLFSVNPVDFLLASKKDRARVLLESMPINLDRARLQEAVGGTTLPGDGLLPFDQLEAVRKQVFDARTGTNRALKEKQSTISQLQGAIPADAPEVADNADAINTELSAATDAYNGKLARIESKLNGLREERDERLATLEEQIRALKDQKSAVEAMFTEQSSKATLAREKAQVEYHAARGPLEERMKRIESSAAAVGRIKQTQDTIAKMVDEAKSLITESERQTKSIESIDAYKGELLATLPIPGLTVVDGEVMRDGVHFDRLNTAQQVAIAVELAKLRAGKLGVVCVDRLECLTTEAFSEFKAQAETSGLQLFVTRVTDGEFAITTA